VVGLFRTNNPLSILVLFFYGLVLKFSSFADPHIPVAQPTDGFLYHTLLWYLQGVGNRSPVIYPIITYLLVFTQAITLNNLIINQRLLPKSNFLPAMSYLLITSFFPEWWQLSSTLIVNTMLVWVWARMSILFHNVKAKLLLFNIGVVLGICSFFYFPSLAFVILMIIALLITRAFRITEWLVGFLGITTPYYFLFAYLYLTNKWDPKAFIPSISLSYPQFQQTIWAWGAMLLLIIPFLISGFYIQRDILRMLIQVRKSWSLLLLYLLTALMVPFINSTSTFEYWILCAVPFAVFHANTFFNSRRALFHSTLHWIMVIFILALNYIVLNS
jgi:Family of unknown function (DUF6427)